jgi:hypothetical protein
MRGGLCRGWGTPAQFANESQKLIGFVRALAILIRIRIEQVASGREQARSLPVSS